MTPSKSSVCEPGDKNDIIHEPHEIRFYLCFCNMSIFWIWRL